MPTYVSKEMRSFLYALYSKFTPNEPNEPNEQGISLSAEEGRHLDKDAHFAKSRMSQAYALSSSKHNRTRQQSP